MSSVRYAPKLAAQMLLFPVVERAAIDPKRPVKLNTFTDTTIAQLDMDSAKLSDWLQIIGMFGVIASLIFVGLEMRQTQRIALSEAYQTRTEIERANIMDSASLPEFRSAIAKLDAGANSELTADELIILQWSMASAVTLWENDHFQYVNGYLSEEHWAKTYANIRCDLANPVQARLIESWAWRSSFLEVIERAKSDNVSDPICWKD